MVVSDTEKLPCLCTDEMLPVNDNGLCDCAELVELDESDVARRRRKDTCHLFPVVLRMHHHRPVDGEDDVSDSLCEEDDAKSTPMKAIHQPRVSRIRPVLGWQTGRYPVRIESPPPWCAGCFVRDACGANQNAPASHHTHGVVGGCGMPV